MRQVKRQKKKKKIIRIPLKWKLIFGVLVVLAAGGYAFYVSPVGQQCLAHVQSGVDYVKNKSGLAVETVIVDGHARTSLKEINEKIGLVRGMPILEVDLTAAQEQIQMLPWVRSVVVERHLPNTIYIKIVEKTPIALWQNQKAYWPVDELGEIVQDNKTPVGSVLLVVGKDALEHTPELIRILDQYPQIREKARSAVRVGNRRWDLILNDINDGLKIKLPENNLEQAFNRIAEQDEKQNLLKRDLKVIDVCAPDRIFVQKAGVEKKKK